MHSSLQELSPHSYSSFVLIGDFNINFRNRDHPYFCKLNQLPRLSELSFDSNSMIDLALVSSPDHVLQCTTTPQLADQDKCSYHLGISLVLKWKVTFQQAIQTPRKFWRYDSADFNRANQLIDQTDWDSILDKGDIDLAIQIFGNHEGMNSPEDIA